MSNSVKLILSFMLAVAVGALALVWYQGQNGRVAEIAIATDSSALSGSALAGQANNPSIEQVRLLTNEVKRLSETVERLQKSVEGLEDARFSESAAYPNGEAESSLLAYYAKVASDPVSREKLNQYKAKLAANTELMTQEYFDALDATDEDWTNEAETFVGDTISQVDGGAANIEIHESTCRSGFCRVSMSLSDVGGEAESSAAMESEHKMLIALSRKFPNSRTKRVVRGGRVFIEGYLGDGRAELPQDHGIMADGRVSVEELQAIMQ